MLATKLDSVLANRTTLSVVLAALIVVGVLAVQVAQHVFRALENKD